jgi:Tfp pilus assembly protein PilO
VLGTIGGQMPFWLHETRAIIALKGIPRYMRLLIILLTITILGGGWIFWIYLPQQRIVNDQFHKISALKQQQSTLAHAVIQHLPALTRHESLATSLELQKAFYPSLQKSVNALLQMMQNREISCRGVYHKNCIKKDFYQKNYVLIDGKGNFRNVLAFLYDVQQLALPVKFKALSLRKGNKDMLKFQTLIRIVDLTEGEQHDA